MKKAPTLIYTLCILLVLFCSIKWAEAKDDWCLTAYSALMSGDSLGDVLAFSADFDDSYYLFALALSKRVGSFHQYLDFEIEGQAVNHFEDQEYMEYNAVFVARWLPFPWDNHINTSLAVGSGLSYVTETSEIEALNHDETSRLLAYLLFELAFSLPDSPKWSLVARLHHRSGVDGLFGNVRGASNALGLGIKYRF